MSHINNSVKTVLEFFNRADVNFDAFKAAALSGDPEIFQTQIKLALEMSLEYVNKLDSKTDANHQKILANLHTVMLALAEISPDLHNKMNSLGLYNVHANDFINNAALVAKLKEFLLYSLKLQTIKNFNADLTQAMREYFAAAAYQTQKQADRLKASIGTHHLTAEDELDDLGASIIDNKRSNGMFDPVKVIGHAISALYNLLCVVPFENALYPSAKYEHKRVSLQNEPRMQLNRQMYGGDLAPTAAGPAPMQMPTPANKM